MNNEKRQRCWSIWNRLCFFSGLIIVSLSLSLSPSSFLFLYLSYYCQFCYDDKFRLFSLTLIFSDCPFYIFFLGNYQISKNEKQKIFFIYLSWNAINSTSFWCMSYMCSMIDECLFNKKKLQVKKENKNKRENKRAREREWGREKARERRRKQKEKEKYC